MFDEFERKYIRTDKSIFEVMSETDQFYVVKCLRNPSGDGTYKLYDSMCDIQSESKEIIDLLDAIVEFTPKGLLVANLSYNKDSKYALKFDFKPDRDYFGLIVRGHNLICVAKYNHDIKEFVLWRD